MFNKYFCTNCNKFRFTNNNYKIMNWLLNFLTSSIGRKLVMSLTGLFLCLFLIIHLVGNLQLFIDDNGLAFNAYAEFMSHNKLIKVASILTMATFLLHAIQGILLAIKNRAARKVGYKVTSKKSSSWSSRNMAFLGTVILVFIVTHLQNFWYQMKFGSKFLSIGVFGLLIPLLYASMPVFFYIKGM